MKKLFLMSWVFLCSTQIFALEIQFIGPCSSKPLLTVEADAKVSNVGALTLWALENNHIQYQGNEQGINQAFNSPIGLQAMEVISDQEMMAYGWCYEIDGVIPEVFPNEILITTEMKVIRWFFGYAHYLNGKWVAQCLKSYERKPKFLCSP